MFVVYHCETKRIVRSKPYQDAIFKTQGAAKACKTRLLKKIDRHGRPEYTADQLEVADKVVYDLLIGGKHQVKNFMTGEMVWEDINTPYSCSVASETYWSS